MVKQRAGRAAVQEDAFQDHEAGTIRAVTSITLCGADVPFQHAPPEQLAAGRIGHAE